VRPIRRQAAPCSTTPPRRAPCPCARRTRRGRYTSGIHRARRVRMKSDDWNDYDSTPSLPRTHARAPPGISPMNVLSSSILLLTSSPFTSTSCYLRHYHLLTSYLPFPDLPPRAPPPPRSLSTCSPSPRPPLSTDCIILMLIIVVFCKCLGRRMRRRDGSNMRDVGGRTSRTRRVGETQRREKMCLGLNRLRNTCVSCGRGT
ncbi:hypothetical protein B0H10DRAFT_2342380, partial [Mycena sp. CBHHK59/15]